MVDLNIAFDQRTKNVEVLFKPERKIVYERFKFRFPKIEYQRAAKFLKLMDNASTKGAKLRRNKNTASLAGVNRKASRIAKEYGSHLFQILTRNCGREDITDFQDFFGEIEGDFNIVLGLDRVTRRVPWELAFDGTQFLFEAYDVGRAVLTTNKPLEFVDRQRPRKALVVGLDYAWLEDDDTFLETPLKEAELVGRRLSKFGYTVKLLLNENATLENLRRYLSQGVGIFHFTGHGSYDAGAHEGFKRSLWLYDDEDMSSPEETTLTEGWLEYFFSEGAGAPWFVLLNACQSARELYGSDMIDEFISYGATHIVGTSWSVFDEPSMQFVLDFYDRVQKTTIGHALQLTRYKFSMKEGNDMATTYPSYVLYGNPNSSFRRAP